MKKIVFITGIIAISFHSLCLAQDKNSVKSIYNVANNEVEVLEEWGYEIVHLDFNSLSVNAPSIDTRRDFSKEDECIILAYGDSLRFNKIQLELYIAENDDWKLVGTGEPLTEDTPFTSYLVINPDKTKNYRVNVVASGFAANTTAGRFFFVVGNKAGKLNIGSNSREYVKWKVAKNDLKYSNYQPYTSTFEINIADNLIKQTVYGTITTYYIETKGTTEEQEKQGIFTYTGYDSYGKTYLFKIDTVLKTIMIIEYNNKNVMFGYIYYLTGDIL